jgi:hypothetical protein
MKWTECYERIQMLSPKSAKLAARMLRKDRLVPSSWAFSLDLALTCRAKGSGPVTERDFEVIAANQKAELSQPPGALDGDQRRAWEFATSVRGFSVNKKRTQSEHEPIEAALAQIDRSVATEEHHLAAK